MSKNTVSINGMKINLKVKPTVCVSSLHLRQRDAFVKHRRNSRDQKEGSAVRDCQSVEELSQGQTA